MKNVLVLTKVMPLQRC